MDITVLFKLTYGLYVVGTFDEGRPVGCIINTCFQVTSQNPIVAISLNKNNYTLEAVRKNTRFSLSILAEDSDPAVIGSFGYRSSRDNDKYEGFGYDTVDGVPVVKGKFAGRLVLDALNFVDNETHYVVFARLVNTVPGEGTPMTYDYFHRVIKGKAPKNAPTYVEEDAEKEAEEGEKLVADNRKHTYKCIVCGKEVEAEGNLPEDFKCPACKKGRDVFERMPEK